MDDYGGYTDSERDADRRRASTVYHCMAIVFGGYCVLAAAKTAHEDPMTALALFVTGLPVMLWGVFHGR